MIRRYMPVDNRNPKREWPCRAVSGEVVLVKCGTITHTSEDLSAWVKSGLLCEFPPVTTAPVQPIAPPPAPTPVVQRTISDSIGNAFSNALSDVFQKPAPSPIPAPAPVVEPVVEASPVVEPVQPIDAPEPVEEEPVDDAVDAAADATDYGALKRAALWALVVERGLDTGREYRSLTKGDLIYILSGGSDVA